MIRDCEVRGRSLRFVDESEFTAYVFEHVERDEWEPDTFDFIDEFANGGTFVDVGAWVGMFSIYAADRVERVVALEPDSVAREMLEQNLALNGIENVAVLPVALWSSTGTTSLHQQSMWGDSMTGPTRDGPVVTVQTITPLDLERVCGGRGAVDLVKVDTEGSEGEFAAALVAWGVPLHLSVHELELTQPLPAWSRPPVMHRSRPENPYYTLVFR